VLDQQVLVPQSAFIRLWVLCERGLSLSLLTLCLGWPVMDDHRLQWDTWWSCVDGRHSRRLRKSLATPRRSSRYSDWASGINWGSSSTMSAVMSFSLTIAILTTASTKLYQQKTTGTHISVYLTSAAKDSGCHIHSRIIYQCCPRRSKSNASTA